jgi:hypothetical protein
MARKVKGGHTRETGTIIAPASECREIDVEDIYCNSSNDTELKWHGCPPWRRLRSPPQVTAAAGAALKKPHERHFPEKTNLLLLLLQPGSSLLQFFGLK